VRDERHWFRSLSGRFLVFEGPDGSGKSTQLRRFVRECQEAGLAVCEVREPGGTAIGEQIRQVLLHTKADMTIRCEMLLYMASRAQLVEQEIKPALAAGKIVLSDRYLASTLAYQGAAGGIPIDDILGVARAALCGVMPDLTLIFDVDEHTAAARINPLLSSTARAGTLDRIESRGSEFHRKVRDGYLAQVRANPETYRRIDASQSESQVWDQLLAVLRQKFPA
jgi:dTMP kinase